MTRKPRFQRLVAWCFVVVATLGTGAGLIEISTKHDYGGFVVVVFWALAAGFVVWRLGNRPDPN